MMILRFADPWFLGLLILIPLLGIWYFRARSGRGATIRFSHLRFLKEASTPSAVRARHVLFIMRLAVLALLITAFARPQSGIRGEDVITRGIDVVLAMDISSSMLAEDITPNRFDASRAVAADFIRGRTNDRIGMTVFAGQAYTQCPLTIDYGILLGFLDELYIGMIEDGTAIGMGLATAVNRLRNSEAKSKVIVLLTDGRNNRGEIDPLTAAQTAQAFDIRVYTIGAGSRGTAMYPVQDPFFGKRYVPMQVDIDEPTLKRIAEMTGGQYFRATDRESLAGVFREIDAMEKTKIEVRQYTRYAELFLWLVAAAVLLLTCEVVLANTRFRKIP